MTENKDDAILERAQEIKAERSVSLTDAMLMAEAEMTPKPEIQAEFEVSIKVKPRVARWIAKEFGGHPELSVEERMAAYFEVVLNRARMTAIRAGEEAPEVTDGGAVTVRRSQFKEPV